VNKEKEESNKARQQRKYGYKKKTRHLAGFLSCYYITL